MLYFHSMTKATIHARAAAWVEPQIIGYDPDVIAWVVYPAKAYVPEVIQPDLRCDGPIHQLEALSATGAGILKMQEADHAV